jgi:hypothetical protein
MQNKSRKLLVPIAFVLLSLVLSGCVKNDFSLTVNADGTISGTGTTSINDDIFASWIYGPDSPYTYIYDLSTPIEIINITFDDLSNCFAENVILSIPPGSPLDVSKAEFRIDVANKDKTVYGFGDITDHYDDDVTAYYQLDNVTLIPKSGNQNDCQYFETINSGAVAVSNNHFMNSLGNPDIGLSMLQIANIPPAERPHYMVLAETGYINPDDAYYIRYPENAACDLDRLDSRFDVLNDRQLMPGEFLALLREKDSLNVKRDDAGWTLYCNYSNISLSNLSRKLPDDMVDPNLDEGGLWKLATDGVSWEYFAEVANPVNNKLEINMDGTYTNDEMESIYQSLELGMESTYTINGVVLSTNGDFDVNKNSVYWLTSGNFFDEDAPIIPNGITAAQPYLNALVGHVVTFKANKSSWSSSKTLGGLKSKLTSLKASSIDTIRIVGIKKFGLTGSSATSNLKIVKKRVAAIKKKLKASKVKADIEVVYLTPQSTDGGDSKYANKVVVQTIGND